MTEPLAAELQRLRAELARVQADAQRRTQEAAVLRHSAAGAFLLRCLGWRVRLIPPHSRREAVYKKVQGVLFRWLRPGGRQPPDPAPPRRRGDGPVSPEAQATKDTFARLWRSELRSFLATGHVLRLPRPEAPLVSVVVVVYNRAELTFQCLRSLAVNADVAFELIVVDNASSDETAALLDRVDPVTVIRNDTNLHFLRGCNQAARAARGEYLLFLNNDACLLPGSLAAAVRTIRSSPDIGTVGAKIVLLDGTLQEAGSIVWGDGSCQGYGRGDSPLAPPYMFQRDVTYSSGAFLLTRRDLFAGAGGFDERFAPAYYEEVDYCMRLWQAGQRSVYDPQVVAYHFEFGSSASPDSAIELQRLHRSKLAEKHARALASLPSPGTASVIAARSAPDRRRVLVVDDRVPHQFLGSGFPRSRAILQSMVSEGLRVTFYPMTMAEESWPSVYQDIPRTVEVILDSGAPGLEAFLRERSGFYDVVLVSRPHNMEVFRRVWDAHPEWLSNARVVYDAEAIFALREIARREVLGDALPASEAERLIAAEVRPRARGRHAGVRDGTGSGLLLRARSPATSWCSAMPSTRGPPLRISPTARICSSSAPSTRMTARTRIPCCGSPTRCCRAYGKRWRASSCTSPGSTSRPRWLASRARACASSVPSTTSSRSMPPGGSSWPRRASPPVCRSRCAKRRLTACRWWRRLSWPPSWDGSPAGTCSSATPPPGSRTPASSSTATGSAGRKSAPTP